jgi:phenylacetate-CoA ligase
MKSPASIRYFNRKLERASREEIVALQFNKLKYQLDYLYHNNSFYRRRLEAAKVTPGKIRSFEDFSARVPFLDKKDFLKDQEENPPFGRRLGVPQEKISQIHITSGTSGVGQEIYGLTRRDIEGAGLMWMNHWAWIGLKKGDIALSVQPVTNLAAGLSAFQGMIKMGLVPLQTFGVDSEGKLNLMKRFRPHFLTLTTAYLLRLTLLAKQLGFDPKKDFPNLKGISIGGEHYPVSLARELEDFWDTRIHEFYGSTQGGTIFAFTCEHGAVKNGERGSMHLLDPYYYTEVIDPDTLKPVAAGEEGEAVVTVLYREASPVLRFRTRDKVRYFPHSHCSCGRPYGIWEAGNVSRYDDMMKIKGSNVWPAMVDGLLFSYPEVDEYTGRVWIDEKGRERVLIRLALKPSVSLSVEEKNKLLEEFARELGKRTGISMEISEVRREELPVYEFKARRWSDERNKGLEKKVWRGNGERSRAQA